MDITVQLSEVEVSSRRNGSWWDDGNVTCNECGADSYHTNASECIRWLAGRVKKLSEGSRGQND